MKFSSAGAALLSLIASINWAQTPREQKLDLSQYGLVKAGCVWYPGRVEFLDDDRLVVSAPVAYKCDATARDKPTETRITEIDLQGHELAAIRRTDVVQVMAGPIGFLTVCTGDHLELLSRSLETVDSITVSERKQLGCQSGVMLSPSRTAMAVWGSPKSHQLLLYHGGSGEPFLQITISKGRSLGGVADDGFLICAAERNKCEVVGSHGPVRSFAVPQLGGSAGYYVVGLVTPARLLVASYDGKRLYAITPKGETIDEGDLSKIKPPFIGSSSAQLSATEPRRILYSVDGCVLGDFDDCYGVVFRRFAVFDSQTSRMIFRRRYGFHANLKISPSGKVVMEQDGPEVRLFMLP